MPGLLIVIGISLSCVLALRSRWQIHRSSGVPFCVAAHFSSLTASMFFVPQLSMMLFMYLPVCLAWGLQSDSREKSPLGHANSPRMIPRVCVRLACASAGVILIGYSISLVIFDKQLFSTRVLIGAGRTHEGIELYGRARRIAPPGISADGWLVREVFDAGDTDAIEAQGSTLKSYLQYSINHEEACENSVVLLVELSGGSPRSVSVKSPATVTHSIVRQHGTRHKRRRTEGIIAE